MHILYAFDRIRCEESFYPMIDVKELYELLTCSEQDLLRKINPALGGQTAKPSNILEPRGSVSTKGGDRGQERRRRKR